MSSYKDEIKQFLSDNFMVSAINDINDDDSLLDLGIIDSTGILELVSFLEEQYDITIEDDELLPENLDSFSNLEKFLSKKINKNQAG